VDKRLVEPGAPLAASEELLPGLNTYDDGTEIRSAVFGQEVLDPATMTVHVRPAGKAVAAIVRGDILVGRVTFTKPDLASVLVLAVRGKEGRSLLHQVEATLRVANVDNRYINELSDVIKVGDVIRAKVIGTRGGPQLATDRPDLGVVKAFSAFDPTLALVRDGNRLVDPERGHVETRKFAEDYGSGRV
jgi:exosome complex component CSL4